MRLKSHLTLAQLMESPYYVNATSGINTISCNCLLCFVPGTDLGEPRYRGCSEDNYESLPSSSSPLIFERVSTISF